MRRRVRPHLLVLLWIWAALVFVVLDLFLNVPEFDGIRPRAPLYRAMRMTAHELVNEPYLEDAPAITAPSLGSALLATERATFEGLRERGWGEGEDPRVRIKALRLLAERFPGEARPALLRVVRDDSDSPKVRAEAARFLGRTGPGALTDLEVLAQARETSDGALRGMGDLGTAAAAEALLRWAKTRPVAREALARVANPDAVPVLAQAAQDRQVDAQTRGAACRALGRTKAPDATAVLVALLETRGEPPAVRAAAAEALGRQGRREAAKAVARARNDPARTVAAAALRASQRIEGLAE